MLREFNSSFTRLANIYPSLSICILSQKLYFEQPSVNDKFLSGAIVKNNSLLTVNKQ